jgi:hypothetical protein
VVLLGVCVHLSVLFICWTPHSGESRAWPGDVDSHSALKLGKLLFPLYALALDLPETFFDDKVSEHGLDPTPDLHLSYRRITQVLFRFDVILCSLE